MLVYSIILIWSVLFFGAVHTYAYTFINIGIILAFSRYCIQRENQSIQLLLPRLEMNYILILFSLLILLYIIPLPQDLIQIVSPESAKMNQLAQSPMDIVNHVPLRWGTLAVSNYPVRHAWIQYMVYVIFFWGLLRILNQHKTLRQLCLLLISIGILESLYGLSQTFIDSGFILWVPKAFLKNKHDTCGTFINRNHFAALMTMLMLFSVAYSASQTNRKNKSKRHTSLKRKFSQFFAYEYQWNQKIIGIIAASIMGLGIYFSASRGAAIAALPGAIVLTATIAIRKGTRKQGLTMVLVGLIIIISSIYIGEDRLIHRFSAIQRAMESRMRYVDSTINLIKDYTILGVGPANFSHAFTRYQSARDQQVTVTHVHNDWLQFFSEMGILGLVCIFFIILFFIRMIVQKYRIRKSPWAICLGMASMAVFTSISAHSLFDFPLHIPGNMMIFISICAIGIQALHLIHYKKQSKTLLEYIKIPLTFRNSIIWIVFTSILVSMLIMSTCHFIAESYCNTVPNCTLHRNQRPETDAIKRAIFWDPGNPVHWYKLAWRYIEDRNTISEKSNPNSWVSIQQKVIFTLEQAVEKNPCVAEYHIRLAWEYHRMHYHETGLQKQKRIESSDIAMKHAAMVCGNKNFSQHMEIANYWNMRSAFHNDLALREKLWHLAVDHYQKSLKLSRLRCKRNIIQQLKLFRRHEKHFSDIFNDNR